jgi:hypothetical protein
VIFRNTEYKLTFNVGVAGRTWESQVSKDGLDYVSTEGTVTEISDGGYVLDAKSGDMDANIITFLLVEQNDPAYVPDEPIKYECVVVTEDPLTYEGADDLNHLRGMLDDVLDRLGMGTGSSAWTYTMYTDYTLTQKLPNCLIRMTSDIEGLHQIGASQLTDVKGETHWMVNPGIYYMWRTVSGYTFDNPDIETVG